MVRLNIITSKDAIEHVASILVTGGVGYIGSHTVKKLIAEGHKVISYDNYSGGRGICQKNVEYIEGDISDQFKFGNTLLEHDVETIIHFAASTSVAESVSNPRRYYQNNLIGSLNMLNEAVDRGVKNIVFSSTCAVYGSSAKIPITEDENKCPVNPYGRTKLFFEEILQDYRDAYGISYVGLRYFNAAGADMDGELGEMHNPETHVIPILLDVATGKRDSFTIFGNDYETPDGTCIRDYVHVDDLASAHAKANDLVSRKNVGEYFNIGSGCGTSVKELVEITERITGRKINVKLGNRRPGDSGVLVADNKKAKEFLKWQPVYSDISNIIKTAWGWHNKVNNL